MPSVSLTQTLGVSHFTMPNPYIFENSSDLIKKLQADSTRELANNFFAARLDSPKELIRQAVGPNTFRAFRKRVTPVLTFRPSVMFRDWAIKYISIEKIKVIRNETEFVNYIDCGVTNLNEFWEKEMCAEMGYGRGAKLLNLVLKKFVCHKGITDEQRSRLIQLLHVPLDSYTILGLRHVAPAEFNISNNPTMRFITERDQYTDFQDFIICIARKAGVPPIYYDILAWDLVH